ncbi:MAG: hypothetical protein K2X47_20365 [Bdellovibrionales bacterium]|nr:hypothetical protein [Bdellovibrionales bacterium]
MNPFKFAQRFQQALLTIATISAFALMSLAILESGKRKELATAEVPPTLTVKN